jgi:hypothetical protein
MPPPLSDDLKERIVKWYHEDQDKMAEIAGQAHFERVAPLDLCDSVQGPSILSGIWPSQGSFQTIHRSAIEAQ